MRRLLRAVLVIGFVLLWGGRAQAERIECEIRVIDSKARPVAGAEVVAYGATYHYAAGRKIERIAGNKKTSDEGVVTFELDVERPFDIEYAARKDGLAMGWARLRQETIRPRVTIVLGEPAVIGGTIVDEKGEAVAGARVRAVINNVAAYGRMDNPEDWLAVKTDADGKFIFNNIPQQATADVLVDAAGRASVYTLMDSAGTGNSMGRFAAGEKDARIVMGPEGKIAGRVVDKEGNGVGGVRVLARANKSMANYWGKESVVSGDDGRFVLEGLWADDYSVQVVAPYEKTAEWVGKDVKVTVKEGETVEDVKVEVNKGGIVEVVVRDSETKEGIEGAGVTVSQKAAFGRHACFYSRLVTGTDGKAVSRALAGPCEMRVWAKGYTYCPEESLNAIGGQSVTQEIALNPVETISGIVRDEKGKTVKGVMVDVTPHGDRGVPTDTEGRFTVKIDEKDRNGYAHVLARLSEKNLAAFVTVLKQDEPVEVTMKPAFILKGKVTDVNGVGIAAASVQLKGSLPGWLTYIGDGVATDAKGDYEIRAVPHATADLNYRVEVGAAGYGTIQRKESVPAILSVEELEGGYEPTQRKETPEIISGGVVELEPFVLARANKSISGVVVDANGQGVANLRLIVTGARGSRTSGQPEIDAVTDSEGKFFVKGVCAGPLRIQAGVGGRDFKAGLMEAEGGDEGLRIVMGQTKVHTVEISLVGKALGGLEEFGVKVGGGELEGKRVLVCFWDYNQRPSRHVVGQLGEMSKELEGGNVKVVLVQAGAAEKDKVSEWMKEKGIKFEGGQIEGDAEKVRAKWGVKSLPWLVLTDEKGVVAAEGIGVEELEGRIGGK